MRRSAWWISVAVALAIAFGLAQIVLQPSPAASRRTTLHDQSAPRSAIPRSIARATSHVASSKALDDYRIANAYPPTSGPLTPTDRHRIAWNRRYETPRASVCGGAPLLFSADRYWLTGADRLEPFVELGGNRPFVVRSSRVEVVDSVNGTRSAPFALSFDGPGRRVSTSFAPAALDLDRPARLRLSVELECDGRLEERAIHVVYAPERALPARFTGKFRHASEAGSLAVHAGIDVSLGGWFVIDANLHTSDGAPVAWARFKGELAAGTHEVALIFFGKLLLDQAATPPFTLSELRGARYDEGTDPDLVPMPPYDDTYLVDDFDASDLSGEAWDAPQRRRKLEMLERESGDPSAPKIAAAE